MYNAHGHPDIDTVQLSAGATVESKRVNLAPDAAAGQIRVSWRDRLGRVSWLLVIILGVQAYLTCRLVGDNTTFVDEATYIYAGHQEIHSILVNHSLTVPGPNGYYQSYFSGAPVLYPLLAAVADSIGGLTAARLLSLPFMLGATILLYCTTSRLYGRRAAILASGIFAFLAPTQFLGSFATYDAMALCLMALAAYLAVKSGQQDENRLTLLYACLAMVAADAVKYVVILFDPIIIGMCVLVTAPEWGWARARRRGYRMVGYWVTMAAALVAVGGHTYIEGLLYSTVARSLGTDSVRAVANETWHLIGPVAVAALVVAALQLALKQSARRWLSVLFVVAVVLAPANQAHLHTLTSLQKHADYGVWFACISAGYLVSKVLPETEARVTRVLTMAVACAALSAVALVTAPQAVGLFHKWSNAAASVAALKPWAKNVNVLAENYFIYAYYLGDEVPMSRWANTWSLTYQDPGTKQELTGDAAYEDAIKHHYYATIALSYGSTGATDQVIVAAIKQSGGYQRVVHMKFGNSYFDVFHNVRAPQ